MGHVLGNNTTIFTYLQIATVFTSVQIATVTPRGMSGKTPGTEPELGKHHFRPTSSSPDHRDLIQQATHTHQNLHPTYTPLESPSRQ
ncbi:unnamed protein product [Brassica rapa]|uniref:Uncharacterized protein n=1 Tax=Brassica campestris TaxID=3711 RepID=A0A8D9G8I6_BRACM|nr:unnamed protein product [Brassica rapa]